MQRGPIAINIQGTNGKLDTTLSRESSTLSAQQRWYHLGVIIKFIVALKSKTRSINGKPSTTSDFIRSGVRSFLSRTSVVSTVLENVIPGTMAPLVTCQVSHLSIDNEAENKKCAPSLTRRLAFDKLDTEIYTKMCTFQIILMSAVLVFVLTFGIIEYYFAHRSSALDTAVAKGKISVVHTETTWHWTMQRPDHR